MRIYLVGLYWVNDPVEQEINIRRGRCAAAELIGQGYYVECPWLDRELLQADDEEVLQIEDLQANSMDKLSWADTVCLLSGWEYSSEAHKALIVAARRDLEVLEFTEDRFVPGQLDFDEILDKYHSIGSTAWMRELGAVLSKAPEDGEESADTPAEDKPGSPVPTPDEQSYFIHAHNYEASRFCYWEIDDDMMGTWRGSCGILWVFPNGDHVDNGMRYCPRCGGFLVDSADKDNALEKIRNDRKAYHIANMVSEIVWGSTHGWENPEVGEYDLANALLQHIWDLRGSAPKYEYEEVRNEVQ